MNRNEIYCIPRTVLQEGFVLRYVIIIDGFGKTFFRREDGYAEMGVRKTGFKWSKVLCYKEEHKGRWTITPL